MMIVNYIRKLRFRKSLQKVIVSSLRETAAFEGKILILRYGDGVKAVRWEAIKRMKRAGHRMLAGRTLEDIRSSAIVEVWHGKITSSLIYDDEFLRACEKKAKS